MRIDSAQMRGEIENQALAERLPRHAGARPAGMDRQTLGRRIPQASRHVRRGSRTNNDGGLDLIDACVAGKKLKEHVIATSLASDESPEIVLNPFALLV